MNNIRKVAIIGIGGFSRELKSHFINKNKNTSIKLLTDLKNTKYESLNNINLTSYNFLNQCFCSTKRSCMAYRY